MANKDTTSKIHLGEADVVSRTDLARVLGVTVRTLTNLVHVGSLCPPLMHGKRAVWRISSLREFVHTDEVAIDPIGSASKLAFKYRQRLEVFLQTASTASAAGIGLIQPSDGKLKRFLLPTGIAASVGNSLGQDRDYRINRIEEIRALRQVAQSAKRELAGMLSTDPERSELFRQRNICYDRIELEECSLKDSFLVPHTAQQLLGTRVLFCTPLFSVRNQQRRRAGSVELTLELGDGLQARYAGPELRQEDGLVLMALINIARDIRVERPVAFSSKSLCLALWRNYGGEPRKRLYESICRLQMAILRFPTFRVQLVQRFDYPSNAPWSITMDRSIVQLFEPSKSVWLDFEIRRDLKNGLASWLYGYVRSQSRLIPMAVDRLQSLCGSDGQYKGFMSSLRDSLNLLVAQGQVDGGWWIDEHGRLHWRKQST